MILDGYRMSARRVRRKETQILFHFQESNPPLSASNQNLPVKTNL
jgi:hypothetical protein